MSNRIVIMSYLFIVIQLCVIQLVWPQLAFHIDANTNSFSLKTPNLQQSFTRFYGVQPTNVPSVPNALKSPDTAVQEQTSEQQQSSIMDRVALAGMTMARSIGNAVSKGGAIRREVTFEAPYIKMFSKTEAGIGEAMKPNEINNRINDGQRRRKRSLLTPKNYLAACYSMMGGGVPTNLSLDGVDTITTRQRRLQKTAKTSKKRKLVSDELSRRKRQVNNTTDLAKQWAAILQDTWNTFLHKVNEKAQNMQQIMNKNSGEIPV